MPYYDLFKPYIKKYVCADIDRNPNAKLLINPDTGKIDAPDCTFDTILSTQVLEHVINPKLYLQEAHRLLKKDGLLLLSTHGHWVYHPDPTDFWRWTRDGLEKTLTDEGFEIIETMGVGGQAVAGLQIFQDSLRKRFPGPFKKMWFGFIALVQLLIDGSSKHNKDACVYLVIARRSNS
jgi:SAM-dependent methyltransferase